MGLDLLTRRLSDWLCGTSAEAEWAMRRVARTAFPTPIDRILVTHREAQLRAVRQFHEAMKPLSDALRRMAGDD